VPCSPTLELFSQAEITTQSPPCEAFAGRVPQAMLIDGHAFVASETDAGPGRWWVRPRGDRRELLSNFNAGQRVTVSAGRASSVRQVMRVGRSCMLLASVGGSSD